MYIERLLYKMQMPMLDYSAYEIDDFTMMMFRGGPARKKAKLDKGEQYADKHAEAYAKHNVKWPPTQGEAADKTQEVYFEAKRLIHYKGKQRIRDFLKVSVLRSDADTAVREAIRQEMMDRGWPDEVILLTDKEGNLIQDKSTLMAPMEQK